MKKPLLLLALAGFVLLAPANLPAQETAPASAPAASAAADQKPAHKNKTLFQVIKEGGIIMIPLGLTSIVMITLIVYGFVILRREKLVPPADVAQLRQLFSQGEYQAALTYCKNTPGFLTNVVGAGLLCIGHGKEVCEKTMEDALSKEVAGLSTRFYYLNLIGVVTPMLGLTGTVLGMIGAFSTLGTSGIGDPSALAGAIGEVLVATVSGLFIAIPAFTFYYVFRNWITGATSYCEEHLNALFRGMPYHEMAGYYFGDDPIFAASPSFLTQQQAAPVQAYPEAAPEAAN